MRIVHCLFSLNIGGAEVLAVNMLNALCVDHQVSLVIVNDRLSETLLNRLDSRVEICRIGRQEGSRSPWPIWQFNRVLVRLRPDVIHCHDNDLIRLMLSRPAPTVYTVHDVGQPVNSRYNQAVAISQAVADDVLRRYNRIIPVVQNGINWEDFRSRASYPLLDNEPFRIIQISRLMPEKKGQDVLINAIAQLNNQRRKTNVQIDFVGSGPALDELTHLAESLGVSDQVRFLGDQSPKWLGVHLADYHALAQPSRYEGFGLTVVEGMAAGLPVIASAIDGPADILRGLPAGYLFPSGDSTDLAAIIRNLIADYRQGRIDSAVRETRRLVGDQYSICSMVSNYLNTYKQVTAPLASSTRFSHEVHQ